MGYTIPCLEQDSLQDFPFLVECWNLVGCVGWNDLLWAITLSISLPLNSISWKRCALILTVCWPLQLIIKMNDWWVTYVWCPRGADNLKMQKHLFCSEIGKTSWLLPPLPDAVAWAYVIFLCLRLWLCLMSSGPWGHFSVHPVWHGMITRKLEGRGQSHWTPQVYPPSQFLGIASTLWEAEVPEAAWKMQIQRIVQNPVAFLGCFSGYRCIFSRGYLTPYIFVDVLIAKPHRPELVCNACMN